MREQMTNQEWIERTIDERCETCGIKAWRCECPAPGETLFSDDDRNFLDFEKGWNEALRFTIGLINEAITHNRFIMGQASLADLRTILKTHIGDAS